MGVVVPQPESDTCEVDNADGEEYDAAEFDSDFDYEVAL
jgi:hypothetical protein